MTRQSRNNWIIMIVFVAALFGILAWATSGFRTWDPSAWFNCWGKGSAVAVPTDTEAEPSETGMNRSAANAGLLYDSEDSSAVFAVTKLPTPTFEYTDTGVYIVTTGYPPIGTVCQLTILDGWRNNIDDKITRPLSLFTSTIQTQGGLSTWRIFVSYSALKPYADYLAANDTYGSFHTGLCPVLSVYNFMSGGSGSNQYVNSDTAYSNPIYFPTTDVEVEFTDTTLRINSFYGEPYFSNPFLNESYPYGGHIGYYVEVSGNGYTDCYTTGAGHNCYNTHNDSLGTIDGEYLFIDLTQLTFVDVLGDYTITFEPYSFGTMQNQAGITYAVALSVPPVYFSISRLAAPTDITFSSGVLSWAEVDGACGYFVSIDDRGHTSDFVVDEPTFDASAYIHVTGEYTVRVRALGNVGQALATHEMSIDVSAFNAGTTITRMVLVNFNVDGDVVSKLVPYGSTLSSYLYDVDVEGKAFGGWYYDTGFSREAVRSDELTGDVTLYARLSDLEVTERRVTWWDHYK
ncbi:MAG: InlB B-repeat-containing protein [Roseburia sp.]|nr:InlB B-repeat-containing protein [Roseburia sp.]